ncbi:hypothetical protein BH10PSE2_BH10PSE2_09950 [soil metagenome]
MSNLPTFEDDRSALRKIQDRLMAWAGTEVGGWTIIGGIALIGVLSVILYIALHRGPAAEDVFSQSPEIQRIAAQQQLGDVADLTVAPDTIQNLTPEGARAWNAALPFSTAPNRQARPFVAPPTDVQSYGRALDCLTAAVYYEAGAETPEGQAAVAQVVLNRVRHPAYPHTVCGVVFQGSERATGCQFTFTCDGALARIPAAEPWARARAVATAALNGRVMAAVGTATHYHTDWVAPYWAPKLAKIVQIRTHIFYRWNGAWGMPAAFTGTYVGAEPVIEKMAALSTAIPLEIEPVLDPSSLPGETPPPPPVIAVDQIPASDIRLPLTPAEPVPVAPTPPVTPPVRPRQDAALVADPMAASATASTRPAQRPRIAAPSGW